MALLLFEGLQHGGAAALTTARSITAHDEQTRRTLAPLMRAIEQGQLEQWLPTTDSPIWSTVR